MREWKSLTIAEIERMETLYPITSNKDLEKIFDVSEYSIRNNIAKPRGWVKGAKKMESKFYPNDTINRNRAVKNYRHTLKKRGYIVPRCTMDIYYTENTNRSHIVEDHARIYGIKISPLSQQ